MAGLPEGRRLAELDPQPDRPAICRKFNTLQIILVAVVIFVVVVAIGRALQWVFDTLRFRLFRGMPKRQQTFSA
ncbi:hypothetical protein [Aliiruegeria haliotis]|uniref:hypothetical protein n=1 Tax=Aliiruegeria haliotis TaxID=1280846 RepID=UPI000D057432|nr:hypothetical protein [Aliiruegeria haliotis]